MRLDKCDAYTAKEILEYREREMYVASGKREENQRGQKEKNPPNNNQTPQ